MHHTTKYNLVYLTILSSSIWLLRKICLNTLNVYEYLIISLVLYPLFMIPLIYYKRGSLSIDLKKINYKIFFYLIIIIFLATNNTIYYHSIIKNENISVSPSLIYSLKIVSVFMLGILFLNEKITTKKIISLMIILIGFFLLASDSNI